MTSTVELVAIRGDEVFKKELTYSEALQVKKKKGWTYRIYQLGYSQYNLIKKVKKAINLKSSHGRENNIESQINYETNLEKFNNNCRVILEALLAGNRLSGHDVIKLGIMEYRKRFDDLKKIHGIPVMSGYPNASEGKKRYKEWWLETKFINEFLGRRK